MSATARPRLASSLNGLSATARSHWATMSARERRLVGVAALLVCAALVWLLLLAPALRVRAEAPKRIAELQASLTRTQAEAAELSRLAALPAAQAQFGDVGAALRQWLKEQHAQAQVAALPGSVTAQVQNLPAWALADLARTARTQWASRVVSAKLKLGPDNTLSGSIGLQSVGSEAGSASGEPAAQGAPAPEEAP